MMGRQTVLMLVIVAVSVAARSATAEQETGPKLTGHMKAYRVVRERTTGREKFVSAERVKPGDVVEYRLKYRNIGTEDALNVALVGPVPRVAAYVADSATRDRDYKVEYSIDGGKTYSLPPLKYRVKSPDGKEIEKTATPDMYTHVKWWLIKPLRPQEAVELTYRVTVK